MLKGFKVFWVKIVQPLEKFLSSISTDIRIANEKDFGGAAQKMGRNGRQGSQVCFENYSGHFWTLIWLPCRLKGLSVLFFSDCCVRTTSLFNLDTKN